MNTKRTTEPDSENFHKLEQRLSPKESYLSQFVEHDWDELEKIAISLLGLTDSDIINKMQQEKTMPLQYLYTYYKAKTIDRCQRDACSVKQAIISRTFFSRKLVGLMCLKTPKRRLIINVQSNRSREFIWVYTTE
jgi:hypothetical protein